MRIADAAALILHFAGVHNSQRLSFTLLVLSLSLVVHVWSPSIIYNIVFTPLYVHLALTYSFSNPPQILTDPEEPNGGR